MIRKQKRGKNELQQKLSNIEKLWDNIAVFEDKEVKGWKDVEPLRQEARACARMQAYVELMEKELDN